MVGLPDSYNLNSWQEMWCAQLPYPCALPSCYIHIPQTNGLVFDPNNGVSKTVRMSQCYQYPPHCLLLLHVKFQRHILVMTCIIWYLSVDHDVLVDIDQHLHPPLSSFYHHISLLCSHSRHSTQPWDIQYLLSIQMQCNKEIYNLMLIAIMWTAKWLSVFVHNGMPVTKLIDSVD